MSLLPNWISKKKTKTKKNKKQKQTRITFNISSKDLQGIKKNCVKTIDYKLLVGIGNHAAILPEIGSMGTEMVVPLSLLLQKVIGLNLLKCTCCFKIHSQQTS